ncbi:hypothetical protein [Oceanobacillus profundus]|uniref:Uncharacterized protein n=1 Tax=Oceanobacillus profundus TaxID=372463 RepID=A0A417YAC0_9BACI|nr:hypothetical protein [Oceanobacillus profundus]MBR3120064.1 hypothetical protein [Oceanobacillus sp.]PAE30846.1 hypothetical protein CHI07_02745 [Paenibacillus sp. 7884-2]MCM3398263.1 hypothetical protein [Oceanobacillus profundus]MDO6451809.1 hypothetical protein [Oceanobacillus profundus]RHW29640.1 hypothetical protein D1B32_21290 [Oceanobacillus profundus]
MQKNGAWLPLLASVGVGAATYYTMTRNNQNLGQVAQKFLPFMSGGMGGNNSNSGNNSSSGSMGPFGMS